MSVNFSGMIDDCYTTLGEPATYQPQFNDPFSILVIPAGEDRISTFNSTKIKSEALTLEARISELACPKNGDTIIYNGKTYTVKNPTISDHNRLIWVLDLYPS